MYITTIHFKAYDKDNVEVILTEEPPTQRQIKAKAKNICSTAFPTKAIIYQGPLNEYKIIKYDHEGNTEEIIDK